MTGARLPMYGDGSVVQSVTPTEADELLGLVELVRTALRAAGDEDFVGAAA